MPKFKIAIIFLILTVFSGCVSAAFEGANITRDEFIRSENLPAAKSGDKIAQYKVGNAFCCSTSDSGAAYDTTVALKWLCASAKQGYAPAMLKIGKIYSGDVIDGLRLARRLSTGLVESVEGTTVSLSIAYAWLSLADQNGIKEAKERMEDVRSSMKLEDMKRAQRLALRELNIPCEFGEVFDVTK